MYVRGLIMIIFQAQKGMIHLPYENVSVYTGCAKESFLYARVHACELWLKLQENLTLTLDWL